MTARSASLSAVSGSTWMNGWITSGKFADEKFVDSDLRNKRAAQDVFAANFGDGRGAAMVDAGKHAETEVRSLTGAGAV